MPVPPARSLPCLPLPLHGRRQASGRNEEQRTEGGVLSFFLAFLSRLQRQVLTKALDDKEATAGRGARPRISTPASYGAISAERGNFHEQERQGGIRRPRAQVQQSNREPPTGPFHAFPHLHTCAFSLISSACFLWQVTAPMRRREGQALRRKRPRYTKPATHGRLLASFLAPICTPIDL